MDASPVVHLYLETLRQQKTYGFPLGSVTVWSCRLQFFLIDGRIPRMLDSVAARANLILVQEGGRLGSSQPLIAIPCEYAWVCILRHISFWPTMYTAVPRGGS